MRADHAQAMPQPVAHTFIQPILRHRWDTRDVRREERFAYYREGLCKSFLAISPERPSSGSISAVVETINTNEFALNRVDLSPHLIRRTKSDLIKMDHEFYHLSLYLGGQLQRDAGTDMSQREVGTLYFEKANVVSDYCIVGEKHLSCVGISIESSLLRRTLERNMPDNICRIPRSVDTEALFGALLLLNRRFSSASFEVLEALGSAIGYLLIAQLSEGPDEQKLSIAEQSGARGMIILVKELIDRELTNPMLSPAFVAARLGVSVRYIHKVFATEDRTFGHYVRGQRLQRIRTDLLDPCYHDLAIVDVAARWGLTDPTTLHRNFKTQFGDTPGQVRLLGRK